MSQPFFTLIPHGTRINFVGRAKAFVMLSIALLIASVVAMGANYSRFGAPLNFGIDFAGGSTVRLALDPARSVDIEQVRAAIDGKFDGASALVVPDADNEVLIRVKDTISMTEAESEVCKQSVQDVPRADGEGMTKLVAWSHPDGGSKVFLKFDALPTYSEVETRLRAAGCDGRTDRGFGREGEFPVEHALVGIGNKVASVLNGALGEGTVRDIVASETVGARVGDKLKVDGIVSLLYAIGFIFLYVMIRFDLRFAPGGIVALTHDAFLVVGAFAITGKEFNLTTVAAVLTVVGYSINDTIVVFDRVRERTALFRDADVRETTNVALNDTLSRTLLTSGTTLIVVLSTYLFGSGAIVDFSFALLVGLFVGTYSSLFIAVPVFLWVNDRFYADRPLGEDVGGDAQGTGTLLGSDSADLERMMHEHDGPAPQLTDGADDGDDTDDGGPRRVSRRRRRRPDSQG